MHRYMGLSEKRDVDWIVSLMLGQREALPSDLYMSCHHSLGATGEALNTRNASS